MEKKYKINEMFLSIQGEGYWTGESCIFIRMAGCNLSCDFCDTDFRGGELMTVDAIVERLYAICKLHDLDLGYQINHVVLTGGEPCLQVDQDLVNRLLLKVWRVQIETNGTIKPDLSKRGTRVWITCSPKSANKISCNADEIKVVFTNKEKVDAILEQVPEEIRLKYIQPMDTGGEMNFTEVYKYLLQSNDILKLSLQTHKIMNVQ